MALIDWIYLIAFSIALLILWPFVKDDDDDTKQP